MRCCVCSIGRMPIYQYLHNENSKQTNKRKEQKRKLTKKNKPSKRHDLIIQSVVRFFWLVYNFSISFFFLVLFMRSNWVLVINFDFQPILIRFLKISFASILTFCQFEQILITKLCSQFCLVDFFFLKFWIFSPIGFWVFLIWFVALFLILNMKRHSNVTYNY